jgi:hypothetical protein
MPLISMDLAEPGGIVVERWPFIEGAGAAGVAGGCSRSRGASGARTVGALDLDHDRPGDLIAAQLAAVLMAADAAVLVLPYLGTGRQD